ncbi:MAG TPA: DUF4178 domain-containing protein [Chloroflexota bacterium]
MTAESRRFLGFALLAASIGITLLMLVWLLTSGAEAGGVVLGLLLLFVLAGPLAGAGWYVLASGHAERKEEQAFVGKRRILEADRLFRDELSARLDELSRQSGLPSAQIDVLADSVKRRVTDEYAWYDAIQLDDARIDLLARYDDLVWEQVRWLRDHPDESPAAIAQSLDQLRQAIDQRTDLLVRGRQAPTVAPSSLMRAAASGGAPAGLETLARGDAITYAGDDYLVEGLATSFADGETWQLAHLAPSGAGGADHWLSVSPGGMEVAWLDALPVSEPGARTISVDNTTLALASTAASLVSVDSGAGSAPGVLVRTWRYRAGDRFGLVEQWPNGTIAAYAGRIIARRDLELWPVARPAQAGTPPSAP